MARPAAPEYNGGMDLLLVLLVAAAGGAAVLWPVYRPGAPSRRPAPLPALDDDSLDREVARYREALRAGTVCARCRFASPPGSRFCADCGNRLPGA